MLAVHPTGAEPDTPRPDSQAVAERGLCSSRYSALKHISCDYHDGVLILRGSLPTYNRRRAGRRNDGAGRDGRCASSP
jgi:hypothetical protein